MESIILEQDDSPKEEVKVEKVEAPPEPPTKGSETPPEPVVSPETPPESETPTEPEIEVDGEKLSLSQIKELKDKYGRDSKWQQKNEERAHRLSEEERELTQLRALKPLLDQRPDIIQQLYAPKPARDFDKELEQHFLNIPDQNNQSEVIRWNIRLEKLRAEQTAFLNQQNALERAQKEHSERENQGTFNYGIDTYVKPGKVTSDEYQQMIRWIEANVQSKNGVYPKEAVDAAFKICFEDKFLQSVKLDATQRAVKPLLKDKNAAPADAGVKKPEKQLTPEDEEDLDFANLVKQKTGKSYQVIP